MHLGRLRRSEVAGDEPVVPLLAASSRQLSSVGVRVST